MAENIALNHATGSYSGFSPSFPYKSVSAMYDNNPSTKFGDYINIDTSWGPAEYHLTGTILLTLDKEYYVSTVEILAQIESAVFAGTQSWDVKYWNGSSYTTVYSSPNRLGNQDSAALRSVSIGRFTDKIQLSFSIYGYAEQYAPFILSALVSEMRVFTDRMDSGVRVMSGGQIVKLAADTGNESPLKIRKGSSTLALLLVPPSDAAASPLRVRHNGVTYAVAKYM